MDSPVDFKISASADLHFKVSNLSSSSGWAHCSLLQGFTYIAPSVLEELARQVGGDSPSSNRRSCFRCTIHVFHPPFFLTSSSSFHRSPRKAVMSPLRPTSSDTHRVFGFDAPHPPTSPNYTVERAHPVALLNGFVPQSVSNRPSTDVSQVPATIVSHDLCITSCDLTPQVNRSASPAISTQSFHSHKKISPPSGRPPHLRLT